MFYKIQLFDQHLDLCNMFIFQYIHKYSWKCQKKQLKKQFA